MTISSGAVSAPVISSASISPRRFRVKRPATLRMTLSEAASVLVYVTQLRNGHLVHTRC